MPTSLVDLEESNEDEDKGNDEELQSGENETD